MLINQSVFLYALNRSSIIFSPEGNAALLTSISQSSQLGKLSPEKSQDFAHRVRGSVGASIALSVRKARSVCRCGYDCLHTLLGLIKTVRPVRNAKVSCQYVIRPEYSSTSKYNISNQILRRRMSRGRLDLELPYYESK